jgi:hypothetical protein
MIIFTKIIAIVIGLTVLTKTYHDFKKHYESLTMLLFWFIIWITIIAAALLPDFFVNLATRISGNGVGVGTFAGIAFIFLLFITYRVYTKANRLENKIHDMVMKLGLKDIEEL